MRLVHRPQLPSPTVALTVGATLALLAFAPSRARAQDAAAPRATADSSFTDAQAERGAQLFTRICLECHERDEMKSADFRLKWGGQSTFDLFKSISTTMPDNNPGMLAVNEYVDVVAYILKLNGLPSGEVELAADSTAMQAAKLNLPPSTSGNLVHRAGTPARAAKITPMREASPWLTFAHARPAPRTITLPARPGRAAGGR